jgi:hypothetical protein
MTIVNRPLTPSLRKRLAAFGDRRMTYIAAFHCRDGIVMCADTQETFEVKDKTGKIEREKQYSEKVRIIEDRSYPLAMGGAGHPEPIEATLQEVRDRAAREKPATIPELVALVKAAVAYVYAEDLPVSAIPKAFRTAEYLIAAKPPNDNHVILKVVGKRVFLWPDKAIIGYDTPPNQAIMQRLFRIGLPMQQAVMLAVYLVRHSKTTNEGVGFDTQIAVVRDNGAWIDHPPYIANSEARVAEFLKLIDDLFLSSIDVSIPPSAFPAILEKFDSDVSVLRKKYLDQSASISMSRLLSEPMFPGEPYAKLFPNAVVEFGTRGLNTREISPEEKERNRMMWEAAKDGNNRLALAQFDELIKDKQILYIGEEMIQVRGTAGLVAASEESGGGTV